MYLLDTNICIYALKNKPEVVMKHIERAGYQNIFMSTIVLSELYFGAENSSKPRYNRKILDHFVSPFKVISFDLDSANIYGKIRAELKKTGKLIGLMDMLIAATALSNDMVLVTNNEKEFNRISDLNVENWSI
jgi:tRNA(fMet)-specific endonuclease VapC